MNSWEGEGKGRGRGGEGRGGEGSSVSKVNIVFLVYLHKAVPL